MLTELWIRLGKVSINSPLANALTEQFLQEIKPNFCGIQVHERRLPEISVFLYLYRCSDRLDAMKLDCRITQPGAA